MLEHVDAGGPQGGDPPAHSAQAERDIGLWQLARGDVALDGLAADVDVLQSGTSDAPANPTTDSQAGFGNENGRRRERLRISTRRVHAIQGMVKTWRVDDGAVCAPGAASPALRVRESRPRNAGMSRDKVWAQWQAQLQPKAVWEKTGDSVFR